MWYSEPNDEPSQKEAYKIAVGLDLGWCKMTPKKRFKNSWLNNGIVYYCGVYHMVWLDFVGSLGSMLDYYDAEGDSARREGFSPAISNMDVGLPVAKSKHAAKIPKLKGKETTQKSCSMFIGNCSRVYFAPFGAHNTRKLFTFIEWRVLH